MDGDSRGGAALSIRAVTGKPIKFLSMGEKLDEMEIFHPDRIASRILGMGDVVTLVEKAQETVDADKAKKLEEKFKKAEFDLEDFRDQLQQIKKMGSFESLIKMIPGMGRQLQGVNVDESGLVRVEAIINSMTLGERSNPKILNGSRRKRIAAGSGTKVQDVNQLMNQFQQMKKMMKQMKGRSFKGFGGMPF